MELPLRLCVCVYGWEMAAVQGTSSTYIEIVWKQKTPILGALQFFPDLQSTHVVLHLNKLWQYLHFPKTWHPKHNLDARCSGHKFHLQNKQSNFVISNCNFYKKNTLYPQHKQSIWTSCDNISIFQGCWTILLESLFIAC